MGRGLSIADTNNKQIHTVYLLESGATCHVTSNNSDLFNIKQDKTKIIVGKSSSCKTQFSGDLQLVIQAPKGPVNMTLKQVFYVPQFNKSIISIPQIAQQGFSVCFNDKQSRILFPDNSVLKLPIQKDGLYYLPATHKCPDLA